MIRRTAYWPLCLLLLAPAPAMAQSSFEDVASALPLRELGPAVAGGRIADIAVHPWDRSTWYVAVGSGGLWKTTNAGTTWTPVFDDQPSYSIGTVALDPQSPDIVWVGTGENVSGRHVAWGTGLYKSRDGGRTWDQVGLPASEHIGRILIHPDDGSRVLVASEGPLWSGGGERGVFMTEDGGGTWTQVLEIDENTGVTDLEFDPSNPDVVYAAAYQRRRHIWGLMSGGDQSGIYKSTDGGRTWREDHTRVCHRAPWGRSAWRSRRPIRIWSTQPSRPRTRSGASTAPPTRARAGQSETATSREARGPTTTRRSRLHPPSRIW